MQDEVKLGRKNADKVGREDVVTLFRNMEKTETGTNRLTGGQDRWLHRRREEEQRKRTGIYAL